LKGSIRVTELGTQRTSFWVRFHVTNHRRQCIAHHPGIRVQKQEIATTTEGQSLVVGSGISHVIIVGDQDYLGELGTDEIGAAIRAAIVHDNDLDL
jgi:hypothetical protein